MKSLRSQPRVRDRQAGDTTVLSRACVFRTPRLPADPAPGQGLPGEYRGWDAARDTGHPSARADAAKPLAAKQTRLLQTRARCVWNPAKGHRAHTRPRLLADQTLSALPSPAVGSVPSTSLRRRSPLNVLIKSMFWQSVSKRLSAKAIFGVLRNAGMIFLREHQPLLSGFHRNLEPCGSKGGPSARDPPPGSRMHSAHESPFPTLKPTIQVFWNVYGTAPSLKASALSCNLFLVWTKPRGIESTSFDDREESLL